MKVKRWLLLSALAALSFGTGLLLLVGRGFVGELYDLLSGDRAYYYLVAGLLSIGGLSGIIWGLNRAAKSVMEGFVSPEGSTSDLIWQKRLLSRGPKVAAIGGGTGLSVLLRGLKQYTSNISAIVTVMDDGGSSGRLRREIGMLPPGDIRNCIIALADDESQMAQVFQHRFQGGQELEGHSLGNLFLAGMERMTGRFDIAIQETSRLLKVRGEVIPATLTNTNLVAELSTGNKVVGESSIADQEGKIEKIRLAEPAEAHPKAVKALREADLVVLGPGSLFTSLIPNLLVEELAEEVASSTAKKFFVVNIMTEPGETDGFGISDHLQALSPYLPPETFDWVIVNDGQVNEEILDQYAEEGAQQVKREPGGDHSLSSRVLTADLVRVVEIDGKRTIKHDPSKLAELIMSY